MEPGATRPEMALISESVANANARIRFFRICFGQASGDQRIARSEVASILGDLSRGGRVAYGWISPTDLSRREVRLVFLLLQCLESALAYGGKVSVVRSETGWSILAEAPRLVDLTGFGQFLQNLRNQGMQPVLTGDFPVDGDLPQARRRRTKPYLVK